MIKYNTSVDFVKGISSITVISIDEFIIGRSIIYDSIQQSIYIKFKTEVTIKDQKITKIDIEKEEIKRSGIKDKIIDEMYEAVVKLIKEHQEDLLNINEIIKVKEAYDLNELSMCAEDLKNYYFESKKHKNLRFYYTLEKESNKLYLHQVYDNRNNNLITIRPRTLISEELIKKSNKFRLKHLLKNYT